MYNNNQPWNDPQRKHRTNTEIHIDIGNTVGPITIVYESRVRKERVKTQTDYYSVRNDHKINQQLAYSDVRVRKQPIFAKQKTEQQNKWKVLKLQQTGNKNNDQLIRERQRDIFQYPQQKYQAKANMFAEHFKECPKLIQEHAAQKHSGEPLHSPSCFEKTFQSYEKMKRINKIQPVLKQPEETKPIVTPQMTPKKRHDIYLPSTQAHQRYSIPSSQLSYQRQRYLFPPKVSPGRSSLDSRSKSPSYIHSHKKKQTYIAPWIEDLSQRLYDGRFKNDNYKAHKCRYSEKMKRQAFQKMVRESTIASRYLTKDEIQGLFQEVKVSQPMPMWRKRIVQFQYDKMRRIYDYEQLCRSCQR